MNRRSQPKKGTQLSPTPSASDETRKQILNAAAHLLRDQGYASTTTRQIADATGIKAGSIYYHFASKDDLLLEVLETGIRMVTDGVKERVSKLPRGASARDRIAAAIHGHLFGLLVHGDFTSANTRVYSQIPEAIRRRHRISRRAYAQYAMRGNVLRTDMPVSFIRKFLLGTLNSTVEWYAPVQGSVEDFADHVTNVIFEGVHAVPKGEGPARKVR